MKYLRHKQKERAGVSGSFRWYSALLGVLPSLLCYARNTVAGLVGTCPDEAGDGRSCGYLWQGLSLCCITMNY
jgi:hypothetical protein